MMLKVKITESQTIKVKMAIIEKEQEALFVDQELQNKKD